MVLFVLEQPLLGRLAAAVTDELARGADHAVTRHDDRDRIFAVRRSDRPARGRLTDRVRDLCVAADLPERDVEQRLPHLALELGALTVERQIERGAVTREVFGELGRGANEHRR